MLLQLGPHGSLEVQYSGAASLICGGRPMRRSRSWKRGGRVEAIQHRVDLKPHHPHVVVKLEGGASS